MYLLNFSNPARALNTTLLPKPRLWPSSQVSYLHLRAVPPPPSDCCKTVRGRTLNGQRLMTLEWARGHERPHVLTGVVGDVSLRTVNWWTESSIIKTDEKVFGVTSEAELFYDKWESLSALDICRLKAINVSVQVTERGSKGMPSQRTARKSTGHFLLFTNSLIVCTLLILWPNIM